MPIMQMKHDEDPGQMLLRKLGRNIRDLRVVNNNVLAAIYERPEFTKGGVALTKTYRDEEQWQGKTVLLIGMGGVAFKEDERWFTEGVVYEVGDWIVMRPSAGMPLTIAGEHGDIKCRLFKDTAVDMKVPSPDLVW